MTHPSTRGSSGECRTCGRRTFLQVSGGMVATAAIGVAGCGDESNQKPFTLGPVSDYPEGHRSRIDKGPFFLLRDTDGLYAMSAVCTHQQCTVNVGASSLPCPCHGSVFDLDGEVVQGPARRALDHFEVTVNIDGKVVVDTRVVVPPETREAI